MVEVNLRSGPALYPEQGSSSVRDDHPSAPCALWGYERPGSSVQVL